MPSLEEKRETGSALMIMGWVLVLFALLVGFFQPAGHMVGETRFQIIAGLLIVADEADGDGLAKLTKTGLPLERLGTKEILGGVFGRDQTVYVAVMRDDASGQFIQRIAGGAARWRGYRLNSAG